jgi:hypothetical protein
MAWRKWVLFLFCAAAGVAAAQTEKRPAIAVPEPQRKVATHGFVLTALTYGRAVEGRDRFSSALPELVRFLSASTEVDAVLTPNEHNLNAPSSQRPLLLYLTGNEAEFKFSEHEKKNLGDYLKSGALLYAEDVRPRRFRSRRRAGAGVPGTPFDLRFKTLIKDKLVLGSAGAYWRKIPKDHPLYSSYFTFADGPPLGRHPRRPNNSSGNAGAARSGGSDFQRSEHQHALGGSGG